MNVSLNPPPLVHARSTIAWPVMILASLRLFDFLLFHSHFMILHFQLVCCVSLINTQTLTDKKI